MAPTLATATKTYQLPASSSQQQQQRRRSRLSLVVHDSSTCNSNNSSNNKLPMLLMFALFYCPMILLISSAWLMEAFPTGAPESACKTLKPGHGGEASSSASPFELIQDKLRVEAGDQIKVTLSSPKDKKTFKGLLVQAVNEKGEPVGKFLSGTGLKLHDSCSAVTHSDREPKKTATLVWEAPSDMKNKETVTFKGTVVHKFDEYYMNIKSSLATSKRRRR